MRKRFERVYSPALSRDMEVLAYGHFGPPMIAFPSGGGQYFDFESNGMVEAAAPWIEAGQLKLYCPQGFDKESWLNKEMDPHWRGVRHNAYQHFVTNELVEFIRRDCQSPQIGIGLTGCSIGAYHAANFALKFAHLFPYALCMSGRYDLESIMNRSSNSPEVYFNNINVYARGLQGSHLEWLKERVHLTLVCGQGPWEDKCLIETNVLADLLAEKGISHERDIWGHDVEHHWSWWRKQFAYHLGKSRGEKR